MLIRKIQAICRISYFVKSYTRVIVHSLYKFIRFLLDREDPKKYFFIITTIRRNSVDIENNKY